VPPIPEPQLDDLYRELILDHYRNPRNRRSLDDPKVVGEGYNPLCGDEVEVQVRLDGGVVSDIGFAGRGCSISQASGSMMTEAVKGKSLEDVRSLIAAFTRMMTDPDFAPTAELGDLEALQGVAKYPVRVKCATLAWRALEEGLNQRGSE